MKQIKAEIYQWAVVMTDDPYLAPELRKQHINGLLESSESDHWITTSSIKGKYGEDCIVTSSGSIYRLMDVREDYGMLFPNARDRLFSTLPDMSDM